MNQAALTSWIKSEAHRLGFDACGISKAEKLDEDARRLEAWLQQGCHGKMQYMDNHFDKRIDPTVLVPGARSVISLLSNYYNGDTQLDKRAPKIAKYAFGTDYHLVLRKRLNEFMELLREKAGQVNGRAFVDSAPVLERTWAARSGLGWVGKNGNLINKQHGSFYFIAELIIDLDLVADTPLNDYCGTCTACLDACPTQALLPGKVVDGSKCISYFTIELHEAMPASVKGKLEGWMFGCDICQDVCPWNRFSTKHHEPEFLPHPGLEKMSRRDWIEITEEVFRKVFKVSPLKRTKFEGITRNLACLESDGDEP